MLRNQICNFKNIGYAHRLLRYTYARHLLALIRPRQRSGAFKRSKSVPYCTGYVTSIKPLLSYIIIARTQVFVNQYFCYKGIEFLYIYDISMLSNAVTV